MTTLGIKINPITLNEWTKSTGINFTSWEFITLMRMNAEFLSQLRISKNPRCINPLKGIDEIRSNVSESVLSFIKKKGK